jgi:DNA-directed RNA polymerase subunit RPC12/RpoP
LQANPNVCPYCGNPVLIPWEESSKSEMEEIENLEKAGRFEDAAQRYEELEMWDKAGECRRKARTNYVVSANLNIGKIGTISMECPHCGASQPLTSKSNEVTCKYCGKNYMIPKNVLDLL